MKHLKSIRVRNLRSFGEDNEHIPLKKINILVGKNSCGKSSLLRTFPLLRQSVQADTKNPILWYGSFVDFGDIKTATNLKAKEIFFDFNLEVSIQEEIDTLDQMASNLIKKFNPTQKTASNNFPIKFTLGISRDTHLDTINRISIQTAETTIEILYKEETVISIELKVGEKTLFKGFEEIEIIEKGNLIPIDFSDRKKSKNLFSFWPTERIRFVFREMLADYALGENAQNKKREQLISAATSIKLQPKNKTHTELKKLFNSNKKLLSDLTSNKENVVDECFSYILGANLHKFLKAIDSALTNFYSGVKYLGPVRASAERFYRYQDLQVAEVDHTGSNLPMVINSLKKTERAQLNTWIHENFGFELQLTNTGSHYAIEIKESSASNFHNVSDMGFGYSQLLPIIVSIWLENNIKVKKAPFRPSDSPQLILAIEQPELHLHPELQYKFGRAIAKIANLQNSQNFCFVLETHSKHIIDAIGECIEEKQISLDDVNITLFEKDKSGFTKTSHSTFNDSGYLVSWPAGFLSP